MDKKGKPFYFRLEPLQLMTALIQIPESERGPWITQVAIELASGTPKCQFCEDLFNEAKQYQAEASERSRIAGLASAEKRRIKLTEDEHGSTGVNGRSTDVQHESTQHNPEAVISSSTESVTESEVNQHHQKKMTFEEFASLFHQTFSKLMPSGIRNSVYECCGKYPPEAIREAFRIGAENGAGTFSYIKAILESNGHPKRDLPF